MKTTLQRETFAQQIETFMDLAVNMTIVKTGRILIFRLTSKENIEPFGRWLHVVFKGVIRDISATFPVSFTLEMKTDLARDDLLKLLKKFGFLKKGRK
jgi:hypothetical protein